MKFKVRKTDNIDIVKELHEKIFPSDEMPSFRNAVCWIAYAESGEYAGFCIAKKLSNGILFLERAGVTYKYRGKRLHQRLITVRLRYGHANGYRSIITYTSLDNPQSANNLIRRGFLQYTPDYAWVGNNFNYWILNYK